MNYISKENPVEREETRIVKTTINLNININIIFYSLN
jgi:hypothetical protein